MKNHAQHLWRQPALRQGAAFIAAGIAGYLVGASLSIGFTKLLALSPFVAWFPATAIAIACTWLINRTWTFQSSDPRKMREFSRYTLVALGAATVNYLVYCAVLALLHRAGFDLRTAASIALAAAIGSLASAAVTFTLSREFAFRHSGNQHPAAR